MAPAPAAAIRDADAQAVGKLIEASGADPNAAGGGPVEAFGLVPQTPRLIAERRGRTAIVGALADAGAEEPPRPEKVVTPHRSPPEGLDGSTVIAAAVGVNGQVPRANGDFAGRVWRGLPHASKVDSKH